MPFQIEHLRAADLQPARRNPRTHSPGQIRKIADSIRRFGFIGAIAIDDENRIVAGHGRWAAAKELGMETLPCVRLSHLSRSERRAYLIADNRTAELAGWDKELLVAEFGELIAEGFDVEATGFDTPEIDAIFELVEESSPNVILRIPIGQRALGWAKAIFTRYSSLTMPQSA